MTGQEEGNEQVQLELARLRQEHRDLDAAIDAKADALFAGLERWFTHLPAEWGWPGPSGPRGSPPRRRDPGPDADTHEDWVPRQVPGFRHAVAMFERLDPRGVVHAPPHTHLMPMA